MSTTTSRDDFMAYTGNDFDELSSYQVFKPKSSKKKKASLVTSGDANLGRMDTLTGQNILTKEGGAEDVFNIEDLRRRLANLKQNSHVKIRKLTGSLKDDFDSLAQYVAWIYNTDSYSVLYAEIQNYFHESETYQPGTIGAYCGGCLVKKKDGLAARGCTVICAGSIPPPHNQPDWEFCSELVIWAVYNDGSYSFTTLNEIEDEQDDKAIIFIENETLETFPGFSLAEKKTLKEHGLNQVRLIYYNPQCNPMYKEVSGGFINLDQILTRNIVIPLPDPIVIDTTWSWWMIVIVAIILIAIFYYFCRCSGRPDWQNSKGVSRE